MERRQALKQLSAIGAGGLLCASPLKVFANESQTELLNYKKQFQKALGSNEQLIGFSNIEKNYSPVDLKIEGKLPNDIEGFFYRNGPAKHERGDIRYKHLFEGDGMLQSFQFTEGKIRHFGKFIETPKFKREDAAKQFLYSGPDTKLENSLPVSSSDTINVANTNVIPVGNDLWALWEAGSPTLIEQSTLDYKQQVNLGEGTPYGDRLKGLPFRRSP